LVALHQIQSLLISIVRRAGHNWTRHGLIYRNRIRIETLGDNLHREIPIGNDSNQLFSTQIPENRQSTDIMLLHQGRRNHHRVARLAENRILGHDVPAFRGLNAAGS